MANSPASAIDAIFVSYWGNRYPRTHVMTPTGPTLHFESASGVPGRIGLLSS